jgi:hypothetical protein
MNTLDVLLKQKDEQLTSNTLENNLKSILAYFEAQKYVIANVVLHLQKAIFSLR